jgi:hypothetical protein
VQRSEGATAQRSEARRIQQHQPAISAFRAFASSIGSAQA